MDLEEARGVSRQWLQRELRCKAPAGSVGRLTGEAAYLAPLLAAEKAFDGASSATEALEILAKEFEESVGPRASKALKKEDPGREERGVLKKIVSLSKPGSGAIAKALTSEFEKKKYVEAAKSVERIFADILIRQESLPHWSSAMPGFLDSYVAHEKGESDCTKEFGREFARLHSEGAMRSFWGPFGERTRRRAANALSLCFEEGLGAGKLLLMAFEEAKNPGRELKPLSSQESGPWAVG